MARILLVISASTDPDLDARIAAGRSPRKDYLELARKLDATVLYRDEAQRHVGTGLVARVAGVPLAQALLAIEPHDRGHRGHQQAHEQPGHDARHAPQREARQVRVAHPALGDEDAADQQERRQGERGFRPSRSLPDCRRSP